MVRFQKKFQTDDRRQTDKTDCLTPLRACARGVKIPQTVKHNSGNLTCKKNIFSVVFFKPLYNHRESIV